MPIEKGLLRQCSSPFGIPGHCIKSVLRPKCDFITVSQKEDYYNVNNLQTAIPRFRLSVKLQPNLLNRWYVFMFYRFCK